MWIFAAALDPSAEPAEVNCFKAWIALAQQIGSPEILCVDAWIRHASLEECIHHQWEIEDRFPGVMFGVEKNGAQTWYWPHYKLMCKTAGRPLVAMWPINNRLPKPVRINSLMGEAEGGRLYFDPRQGDQQRLINQWLDHPNGKFIDGPDGYEMALRTLRRARRLGGFEVETPVTPEEIAAAELRAHADHVEMVVGARREQAAALMEPTEGWDPGKDEWLHPDNDALFEVIG